MAERKAEYSTGKYADGFGPGKGGMWFVKRVTEEVIAYADDIFEAQQIADAFKKSEAK